MGSGGWVGFICTTSPTSLSSLGSGTPLSCVVLAVASAGTHRRLVSAKNSRHRVQLARVVLYPIPYIAFRRFGRVRLYSEHSIYTFIFEVIIRIFSRDAGLDGGRR